jgi:hypothetical protein
MIRGGVMPRTEVLFFANSDGSCPFLQWFDLLPREVQNKCTVRIERLVERGFELRRPEADLLRDGIYELRASREGIHYRMLYFFHKQKAVIWTGIIKESKVPSVSIERAIKAKELYEQNPDKHTYIESND